MDGWWHQKSNIHASGPPSISNNGLKNWKLKILVYLMPMVGNPLSTAAKNKKKVKPHGVCYRFRSMRWIFMRKFFPSIKCRMANGAFLSTGAHLKSRYPYAISHIFPYLSDDITKQLYIKLYFVCLEKMLQNKKPKRKGEISMDVLKCYGFRWFFYSYRKSKCIKSMHPF